MASFEEKNLSFNQARASSFSPEVAKTQLVALCRASNAALIPLKIRCFLLLSSYYQGS